MKKLFGRSFVRALIITVVSALIIVGGIYAYETLWSGKAHITIEPPVDGATGEWELIDVTASDSTWDDATGTWTASVARGEWMGPTLTVQFKNTGGDVVTYKPYVNGHELQTYVAPGVLIQTTGDLSQLAAGETGYICFRVSVKADAESGTLPEVQLELRTD